MIMALGHASQLNLHGRAMMKRARRTPLARTHAVRLRHLVIEENRSLAKNARHGFAVWIARRCNATCQQRDWSHLPVRNSNAPRFLPAITRFGFASKSSVIFTRSSPAKTRRCRSAPANARHASRQLHASFLGPDDAHWGNGQSMKCPHRRDLRNLQSPLAGIALQNRRAGSPPRLAKNARHPPVGGPGRGSLSAAARITRRDQTTVATTCRRLGGSSSTSGISCSPAGDRVSNGGPRTTKHAASSQACRASPFTLAHALLFSLCVRDPTVTPVSFIGGLAYHRSPRRAVRRGYRLLRSVRSTHL